MTKNMKLSVESLKTRQLLAAVAGFESTDNLDPLGTSEESGAGDIIIYRDRYGEIERTSETHR